MAQGDVWIYDKFVERVGDGDIDLTADEIKCALCTSAGGVPGTNQSATNPGWDVSFTQDLSSTEVSAGGGYTAGGVVISTAGDPWALVSGGGDYTGDNAAWTSNNSGDPTGIGYGVIYINSGTASLRFAVGYCEVWDGATPVSLLAGDIQLKWNGGASTGVVFQGRVAV